MEQLSNRTRMVFYVAAILSLLANVALGTILVRTQDCIEDYANKNNKATKARSDAAEARQKALDDLMANFLTVTSREESRRLLEHYVAARKAELEERAKNPIPQPPEEYCR